MRASFPISAPVLLAVWMLVFPGSVQLHSSDLRSPSEVIPGGETLVYEVRWDPPAWLFFIPTISAGEMTLKFEKGVDDGGRPIFRITADAVSAGVLPRLTGITVKDHFESLVAAEGFCSNRFTKITREGRRHRDVVLTFDQESHRGRYLAWDAAQKPPRELKNEVLEDLPPCVQDFLSAIYRTRLRGLGVGENYPLHVSDNGVVKEVDIRAVGREQVEAIAGTWSAIRINTVSVGGLFKGGGSFVLWFSDDGASIPVKYEAQVKFGKLFGTIKHMEGTAAKRAGPPAAKAETPAGRLDQFLDGRSGFVVDGVGNLERTADGMHVFLGPIDAERLVDGRQQVSHGHHPIGHIGAALVARPDHLAAPDSTAAQHH
ncbi:MAG: DUF3108 domain-containing protein [Acidobacteria bacterium]|nr:DUF3108 domain-containing protein [Acidobacteriota bacterium]